MGSNSVSAAMEHRAVECAQGSGIRREPSYSLSRRDSQEFADLATVDTASQRVLRAQCLPGRPQQPLERVDSG